MPSGEVLSEQDAYIALNLLSVSPARLTRLLSDAGSSSAALTAVGTGAIGRAREEPERGGGQKSPQRTASSRPEGSSGPYPRNAGVSGPHMDLAEAARIGTVGLLSRAGRECKEASRHGFSLLTLADREYPALLREIPDPPPVLYIWGSLDPDDEVRLAVVGSRRASRTGLTVAGSLACRLGRGGIAVVSGLARGIDSAAHRGALSAPARTIAVLGSGLDVIYPRENLPLAREIAAGGAVVSEYPLGVRPHAHLFPRRNRVISGLSAGVVVVEAAAGSGALGTARLALDQGRELYVLPGSVLRETSAGTNGLLREGVAHIVTRPSDVFSELPAVFRVRLGLPASPPEGAPRGSARAGALDSFVAPFPDAPDQGAPTLEGDAENRAATQFDRRPGKVLRGPWTSGDGRETRGPARPAGAGEELVAGSVEWSPGSSGAPVEGSAGSSGAPAEGFAASRLDPFGPPVDPDADLVLRQLDSEESTSIDHLMDLCGLPVSRLLAALSSLELRGLVESLPGNRVIATNSKFV